MSVKKYQLNYFLFDLQQFFTIFMAFFLVTFTKKSLTYVEMFVVDNDMHQALSELVNSE